MNKKIEPDILSNHGRNISKKANKKSHQRYRESIIKYICENKETKNTNRSESSSIEPNIYKDSEFANKLVV